MVLRGHNVEHQLWEKFQKACLQGPRNGCSICFSPNFARRNPLLGVVDAIAAITDNLRFEQAMESMTDNQVISLPLA